MNALDQISSTVANNYHKKEIKQGQIANLVVKPPLADETTTSYFG